MKVRSALGSRLRNLAVALVAASQLGACAGVLPPGEAAPAAVRSSLPRLVPTSPPEQLGTVERFAWQLVVALGDALASGDVDGFLGKVSPGFYRGYANLDLSVRTLIADSSSRTVVVAVRDVSIEEERVLVNAQWTGSFTHPDGSVTAKFGETTFVLLKNEKSLRLLDYHGAPPFAIEGI